MKKRVFLTALAILCILGCMLFAACEDEENPPADTGSNGTGSNDTVHTHAYATEWSRDANSHWHACTGAGCDVKSDLAAHVYENDADATCNVCGYERAVVPSKTTYTIAFETNGGSPVAQIEAEAGDGIAAPTAPTKSGERFVGWYESADGGTTLHTTAFVFGYMPGKNITLYAKWQDAVIGSWETYQVVIPAETEGDPETVYNLGDTCNFPVNNTTLAQNTYQLTVSDTNITLAMLGGALNGSGTYTKTDGVYKADIAVAYGSGTETFKTQTTYDAVHDRLLCNIVYYEDETSTLYYTLILTRVNGEA